IRTDQLLRVIVPVPWVMEAQPVGVELCPVPAVAVFDDQAEGDRVVLKLEWPDSDVAVCEVGDARYPFLQEEHRGAPALPADAWALHRRFQVIAILVEFMQVDIPVPGIDQGSAGPGDEISLAQDVPKELPARP